MSPAFKVLLVYDTYLEGVDILKGSQLVFGYLPKQYTREHIQTVIIRLINTALQPPPIVDILSFESRNCTNVKIRRQMLREDS